MEIRAQHRNARMAPRKIRVYREAIKGLPVTVADAQLQFMPGQGPALLRKVLRAATANARHNFDIAADSLTVTDVIIDGGYAMKRFQPVSRGMAHPILKRMSHITIVVTDAAGKTAPVKGRKTKIQEFTADDIASGKVGTTTHVEEVSEREKPAGSTRPVALSKQEETYTKMKMQQQGGDPKKAHRRKSIGE